MKNLNKYILFLLLPFLINCSDNENWTIVEDIQQGVYISGTATIYSGEAPASALRIVPLDGMDEQPELVGIYTWLKSDGEFSISIATDLNIVTKYGNGGEISKDASIAVYSLAQDAPSFKVDNDGLYFVIANTSLKEVSILPVTYGVIGSSTPQGWNAETPLGSAVFDGNTTITWNGKLNMAPGGYKFRYSGDWGKTINSEADGDTKIFTDLGNVGESQAPLTEGSMTQVRPGGPDFTTEFGGEFEYTIQYNIRSRLFNATFKLLGEAIIPPEYPEKVYLVGDATAYGWDTPGSVAAAEMHKVAGGKEGLYWKILFIEEGKGFKVSEANWGTVNLGYGEISSFDPESISISDSGGNMSVETSGIYTVVLDLRDDEIKLSVVPAKVYGIGDAFGGWDGGKDENLFTVDNNTKTVTSPALPANGNIRMYVSHSWISDWWQAEFNVFGTTIEYRNDGGDQEAVPGTAGQVIKLNFDENTGSIE